MCKKMFGIDKDELDTFMIFIDDAFMYTSNLAVLFESKKYNSEDIIDANMCLEEFQLFCYLLYYKMYLVSLLQKVDNHKVDAVT